MRLLGAGGSLGTGGSNKVPLVAAVVIATLTFLLLSALYPAVVSQMSFATQPSSPSGLVAAGLPLTDQQSATIVLGQTDFFANNCYDGVGGNPDPSSTTLCNPDGMAFDSHGDLWVADASDARVLEYTPPFYAGEAASIVIGQTGFTSGTSYTVSATSLYGPFDLAFDSAGDLWVADTQANRILEYIPGTSGCSGGDLCTGMAASVVLGQSSFTTMYENGGASGLDGPQEMAFDSSGDLWVADSGDNRVVEYVPGTLPCDPGQFCDGMPAATAIGQSSVGSTSTPNIAPTSTTATTLDSPTGVAFDSSGDLWVADLYDNRVVEYVPGSSICSSDELCTGMAASVVIGQTDETSVSVGSNAAGHNNPWGLGFDSSGDLWVADFNNGRVLEYPAAYLAAGDYSASLSIGQPSPSSGSGCSGIGSNTLCGPRGVAFDSSGNLWVSDWYGNRVLGYGPSISLSATSGPIGTPVTVTGSGFAASDTALTISSSPGGAISGPACTAYYEVITSCSFTIAAGASGAYSITVSGTEGDGDFATASSSFTVTTPSISLSESAGNIGDTVSITGTGFDSSDGSLTISSSPTSNLIASPTCNALNQTITSCSFEVAPGAGGSYTVQVTGPGGPNDYATAPFLVLSAPTLTLSPTEGPNGALVSASGTGFTADVSIGFTISTGGTISSATSCVSGPSGAFSDCSFEVTGTPSTVYEITGTGADSSPGGFDSASTTFTVGAVNAPAGGVLFASLPLPVGLAVNSTRLFATELNDCTTIFSISSTGKVSSFATAPDMDVACEDAYPAISTGFGFFPQGEVFLTQGPYVFEVGPHGGTMSLFATIRAFESSPAQPTGITFDTVGTFGFQMVLTGGASGTVVTLSSSAAQSVVGNVETPVEGPAVAPLTYGAYAGDLLVGTGATNSLLAVSPAGAVTPVSSWPGAWSVSVVPTTTCSYDGTDPYFVADESAGAVYAFSASHFTNLGGDALVTSDSTVDPSGVAQVPPSGSASSFSSSTDLLPGSSFAFCPVFGVQAEVTDSAFVEPYEMAYDPVNGLMYVSDHGSNVVYLFNSASTIVDTLTVGTAPAGIAYDPINDEMMVANTGSNSVTFINAKTNVVLGSVAVGAGPEGLAFDLYDLDVYVANTLGNSVSVINPFDHVVGSISTGKGSEPFGVAFNPLPLFAGYIYTANMGGTLSVIRGLSLLTTLTLPCAAANIAEDFVNGEFYVADYGCSEVTIVAGTTIVTSITVGTSPFGVAFDPTTGYMYVSNNGPGTLTVLSGTKVVTTVFLGPSPWGVTFDPANNLVYIAIDPTLLGGDSK